MDYHTQTFIEKETHKAHANGIEIQLNNVGRLDCGGTLCNGFFEPEMPQGKKILSVAVNKPLEEWLPIFVHETSHMEQYLEQSPHWMTSFEYDDFDNWLQGRRIKKDKIQKLLQRVILLEADCEIRSLQKIKEYNLPISEEAYCKSANAYLFFHHWVLKNRKWYNVAPYEIEEILNKMSPSLFNLHDYLEIPSRDILNLFEACR